MSAKFLVSGIAIGLLADRLIDLLSDRLDRVPETVQFNANLTDSDVVVRDIRGLTEGALSVLDSRFDARDQMMNTHGSPSIDAHGPESRSASAPIVGDASGAGTFPTPAPGAPSGGAS